MKLKSLHMALVVLIAVFGGIGLSAALGMWATTNDKIPAVYTSGEAVGQFNPADIKGSYTFDEIQKSFDVPVAVLGAAFGVPDPDKAGAFQCKELETLYAAQAAAGQEIGTGSIRYFVALYSNLPFEAEEGTYLPLSAVKILQEKGSLTPETLAFLEEITVDIGAPSSAAPAPTTPAEVSTAPLSIKGSTTFQEILDAGLSPGAIEAVIGGPLPDSSRVMKEYATEKGVEFSQWKDALQKILDEK